MRNIRGIIVLAVAVVSGIVAAQLVSSHLRRVSRAPAALPSPAREAPAPAPPDPKPLGFAASVPVGKRAVTLSVDKVTGVSEKVQRGDLVDVVATTHDPADRRGHIARIVLEQIEVLEVAGAAASEGEPYTRRGADWTVTLAVDPLDAAVLSAADATGTVSLLVRNPEDDDPAETLAAAFSPQGGAAAYPPKHGGYDLAALVPEGMRVFTLESSSTDGVGGDIQPGDCVDVVLTCPYSQFSTGKGGLGVGTEGEVTATRMASRILLQRVPVIAARRNNDEIVAQPTEAGPGHETVRGEQSALVSLLVTPEQAEQLTVASDASKKAVLRLLLRNPGDEENAPTPGVLLLDLLTERHETSRVQVVRGNALQERKFYVVGDGRNRSFHSNTDKQDIGVD